MTNIFENSKRTQDQGNIGLAIAISWFAKNGFVVSIPLTDSQDYDLIIEKKSIVQKIQVKTCRRLKHNGWSFNISVHGGTNKKWNKNIRYLTRSNNIDQFFFVTATNRMFLIPKEILKNFKRSIQIGPKKYLEYEVF